jgi:hypothetical protein
MTDEELFEMEAELVATIGRVLDKYMDTVVSDITLENSDGVAVTMAFNTLCSMTASMIVNFVEDSNKERAAQHIYRKIVDYMDAYEAVTKPEGVIWH